VHLTERSEGNKRQAASVRFQKGKTSPKTDLADIWAHGKKGEVCLVVRRFDSELAE
jgi:hypothetical protein